MLKYNQEWFENLKKRDSFIPILIVEDCKQQQMVNYESHQFDEQNE